MRTLASAVLVLALAACAFGGGTNSLPGSFGDNTPAVQNALGPDATATLQVSIAIPIVKSGSHFVSPGTQSLVIVEGKNTVLGTFDTQRSSHGCKKKGSNLDCTFSVSINTGKQILSFKTYDQKNGKGAVLATSRVVKSIAAGINKISLSLKGITKSIVVGLSEGRPLVGKSSVIDVIVTALDASGAVITGKYSSTIKLTDSDTSGATRLSGTKVTTSTAALTLAYNGSKTLASAIINAKASKVKSADITPATLRPTTTAGVTISGTAAFTVVSDASGNVAAYLPVNGSTGVTGGVITITVAKDGTIQHDLLTTHALRPALTLSPAPDECAPDIVHSQIYCMSFQSNIINILKFDPSDVLNPLTYVGKTATDAPVAGVTISAGTCVICGIAYDPNDNAYIISTANGYELWPTTAGATVPLKTLPAPVSENFGYNAVTNQIYSPWYGDDKFDACSETVSSSTYYTDDCIFHGMDLIDVASTNRYMLASPPPVLNEPDAGAVDTKTNIGIAPEEFALYASSTTTYPVIYLDNLNTPPDVFTAQTPVPSPLPSALPDYMHGSYTSPVAIATPNSALIKAANAAQCDLTYTAADSVKDLGFFGEEFCASDYIAVAQLPASSSGTLAISNYVAAEMPKTPKGTFVSPRDPHAVLVINIPGICDDCGILFNYDKSYLAIIDLNGLLALNPGGGEKDIPTTSTLKGIVTYIATGVSSPPSDFVRALENGRRLHRHR